MNIYERLINAIKKWKEQKDNLPQHQDGDSSGQAPEASGGNSPKCSKQKKEKEMSIARDLVNVKNLTANEFDKVTLSLEAEIDKMVASINNVSSRSFGEVENIFSIVENHLAMDARLGLEEAKKLVSEIKSKL